VWFRRIADAGYTILCLPQLAAHHHHRNEWRSILREYYSSGRGAADYAQKYPHCRFTRTRRRQLLLAVATIAASLLCIVTPLAWPYLPLLLGVGLLALLALGVANVAAVRRPVSLVYPFVTLILATSFCWGMAHGLALHQWTRDPLVMGEAD
jgi:hypothetical protein